MHRSTTQEKTEAERTYPDPQKMIMVKYYLATVQSVILIGGYSWIVSERNLDKQLIFHYRAIRYMPGEYIREKRDRV